MEIQERKEIQDALDKAFREVIEHIRDQDDDLFLKTYAPGKWTTGEQLVHLIKSTRPLTNGLGLPKFILRWKFRKMNRKEYTFQGLKEKYEKALAKGGQATKAFLPKPVSLDQKSDLLIDYDKQRSKLIRQLNSWGEKELSEIAVPHPLLGYLSIREVLYFTVIHNYHHLELIRKVS